MSENTWMPKTFIKRNEFGLIEGKEYQYDENNFINWRKLINPKFLTPNRQNFEKSGQEIPTSIDGLEDKDLLILLNGVKELLSVRGYNHLSYQINAPSENVVIATCSITFIPNFETENRQVTFSAVGDATIQNTNSFGKLFLGPIAENRAFVRCVRNFLRIHILGQDELPQKNNGEMQISSEPVSNNLLEQLMVQHSVSWETIKTALIKDKFEGAEKFEKVSDIPRVKQLDLIARIKTKFENK